MFNLNTEMFNGINGAVTFMVEVQRILPTVQGLMEIGYAETESTVAVNVFNYITG